MELKERRKKGWVLNMVDFDHVPLLCEKARKLDVLLPTYNKLILIP